MRALVAIMALMGVVGGGLACGRTSPEPCRAREGLTCEALVDERALEQRDFDAAVAAADAGGAQEEGACVQRLVAEQLERRCIADPCVELCALHPCPLRDIEGAPEAEACIARCQEEVAEANIAAADLEAALLRAAANPTLCSCAICEPATQPLCDELWLCAGADPS